MKDELLPDEMKESYEQEINVIKNIKLNVSSEDNNINNNNEILRIKIVGVLIIVLL